MVDDSVIRLTSEGPIASPIMYRRTGADMNLEGNGAVHSSFDGKVIYRNKWVGTNLSEDDIAVASHDWPSACGRATTGRRPILSRRAARTTPWDWRSSSLRGPGLT
jgi:hypothetical protein